MTGRLFWPPTNPWTWWDHVQYGKEWTHRDDDQEEIDQPLIVATSEIVSLPADRGRRSDTSGSRMYTPSILGKCKRGYYYNSKLKKCVKR